LHRVARGKSGGAGDGRQIEIDEDARAIRVRDPRIINTEERAFCRRLLEAAARQPGVSKAEVDLRSASCLVEFGSGPANSLEMADVFAGCVGEAAAGSPSAAGTPAWRPDPRWLTLTAYPVSGDMLLGPTKPGLAQAGNTVIEVATGARRVIYLALAGGAFAMTLVGLIIPGIPTVPFLLATSYCLARSSRRLDALLRRSTFFGPIVVDWEQQGGLSRLSKGKLIGLTAAVALVTIVVSPLSSVVIGLVLLVSSLGIYRINRLPSLPGEQRAGVANQWLAGFAVPAP